MRFDLPKPLRSVFVAGALALVLPLAASAQTGSIAGTVTSGVTPLSGVTVRIYNASESFVVDSAPTSATGAFTVPNLAPGTYYAFAWAGNISGGYVDELYPNTQCIGGPFAAGTYCRINTGVPIAVTSGGTTTGIDFDLAVGGSISGTVTAGGVGYANSLVEVHLDVGGTTSQIGTSAFTSASGAYQLSRLPAGNYFIWAGNVTGGSATGYVPEMFSDLICPKVSGGVPATGAGCSLANATPVPVSLGASTPVSLDLALGGAVVGSVFGNGLPREGLFVSTPGVGPVLLSASTSSVTGAYVLRGLPAGVVSLTGSGPGYAVQILPATVSAGAISAGPNFNLALGAPSFPPQYYPQGRSVISGQSTTLSISAVGQAPLSYQWYLGLSGDTSNPIAGANSSDYTTPPLVVPTNYWVRVTNVLGTLFSPTIAVTIAQAGSGAISGTIVSGATPVANATVTIFSSTEQVWTTAPRTSASGAFSVAGLTPGTYYAFASYNSVSGNVTGNLAAPPEFPYADTLYPNIPCAGAHNVGTYCRINTSTPIVVTANTETSGVNFDMPVGNAITGTITTNGQVPGPSAGLQLSLIIDSPAPSRVVATGHVDPVGTLVVPRLPAGTYRIAASGAGLVSEVWDDVPCLLGNCVAAGGVPIVVPPAGTVTGKNFDLVTPPPPPLITTQPQSQSIANGQSATLSVAAAGTAPIFYQWYRGSSGNTTDPITGATSSTYNTGPLARGGHEFWVRVINYGGVANSVTADVTVNLGGYRRTIGGGSGGGGGTGGGTIGPNSGSGGGGADGSGTVGGSTDSTGRAVGPTPATAPRPPGTGARRH
jgi:Ig-like domain CHU_C associated